MKYTFMLAAIAALTTASPLIKRQVSTGVTDVGILNYALTLEHLEDKFYREGLANYTQAQFIAAGFPDPFYDNLKEISCDETTHVSFLSGALGSAAVAECTCSFPSIDPKSFVVLASVLEGVGVSAYLGAAALIVNKDYLITAGSILIVESCHNAYIRSSKIESPFPYPFDTPLTFDEVYTLAASFIVSCRTSNAAKHQLPLKPFPALALGTSGLIKSGDTIVLMTPGYKLMSEDGKAPFGFTTIVPECMNGQSYVMLTSCKERADDETVVAGLAIVEVTNPYPMVASS